MLRGQVWWFSGLSGAGKTTLAGALAERLSASGRAVEVLDGDELRQTLCQDLGFGRADRAVQAQRAAFVARKLARHGVTVLISLISPDRQPRDGLIQQLGALSIFVDAPLPVLMERDPKGLYARALAGELSDFAGLHFAYEPPIRPALHLRTDQQSLQACLEQLWALVESR